GPFRSGAGDELGEGREGKSDDPTSVGPARRRSRDRRLPRRPGRPRGGPDPSSSVQDDRRSPGHDSVHEVPDAAMVEHEGGNARQGVGLPAVARCHGRVARPVQDTTYVPGTGYPCMIIRIKRESQFFTEPPADPVPGHFKGLQASDPAFKLYFDDPALDAANGGTRIVVLFDRCVHLCCYPGWHVVNNPPPGRDYSAYGASPPTYVQFQEDPVYCVCHGSQYDPMLLVVNVHPSGASYVGAERVHGPAPRALAVIPVKAQGSTLVGGAP